jgi:hypothetical protein
VLDTFFQGSPEQVVEALLGKGWFGRLTRRARSHRRPGRARRREKQASMIKGTILLLVATR